MASNLSAEQQERALNVLIGQFVGDALGTRYEFMPQTNAIDAVEKDVEKCGGRLKILGGGPFELDKGQATDDTELAMALARSMLRNGSYNSDDVASSYVSWFCSPPFDIGNTTRAAFYKAGTGRGSAERMMANSQQFNSHSLSNGCLMRISPLGIAGAFWDSEKLAETAKADCRLTNPHPIAQDAVAAFVVAIATGIRTGDPEAAYAAAKETAQTEDITKILEDSRDHAWNSDFPGGMGYLGIALQRAFHELLSDNDFYTSMLSIARFGGDTDTNGCIAGALLGSVISDNKAIPEQWVKAVRKCNPKRRLREFPWIDASDMEDVVRGLCGIKESTSD